MNRWKKPLRDRWNQASKPKPLTHEHKASKSHIINSLLTSFVRSVRESICPRLCSHKPRSFVARSARKPQANTFPYRPRTRLMSNQYVINIYIYIYIYIYNYRRNSFGLLGLISVVLTSRMEKPTLYWQLKCSTLVVHLSHARVLQLETSDRAQIR